MSVIDERIAILSSAGFVDEDGKRDLQSLVRIVTRECGVSRDDELLGTLVTHVAAAFKRSKDGESIEPLSPGIVDEAKTNPVYPEASRIQQQVLEAMKSDLSQAERDFILVHVGGLLISRNEKKGKEVKRMRIAVGGLNKNQMEAAIKKAAPDAEVTITNDMTGAQLIKQGKVDYYFGACHSGGGAAISVLIGLVGYPKCCIVCKNARMPDKDEIEKYVNEGKVVFGMTVDTIDQTVPLLIEALKGS